MTRSAPRFPRPLSPHRNFLTPPAPSITAPCVGRRSSACWRRRYSTSVVKVVIRRVNTGVSMNLTHPCYATGARLTTDRYWSVFHFSICAGCRLILTFRTEGIRQPPLINEAKTSCWKAPHAARMSPWTLRRSRCGSNYSRSLRRPRTSRWRLRRLPCGDLMSQSSQSSQMSRW